MILGQLGWCSPKGGTTCIDKAHSAARKNGSGKSDGAKSWWGSGDANYRDLPGSFPGLIGMYSHKKAAFLKCNRLIAYPVHAVWLKSTAKPKKYLIDHRYMFLGLLPAGSAEGETENIEGTVDKNFSQYMFSSLEVYRLKKLCCIDLRRAVEMRELQCWKKRCVLSWQRWETALKQGLNFLWEVERFRDDFRNWFRTAAKFQSLTSSLPFDAELADTALVKGAQSVSWIWYRAGRARVVSCRPPLKRRASRKSTEVVRMAVKGIKSGGGDRHWSGYRTDCPSSLWQNSLCFWRAYVERLAWWRRTCIQSLRWNYCRTSIWECPSFQKNALISIHRPRTFTVTRLDRPESKKHWVCWRCRCRVHATVFLRTRKKSRRCQGCIWSSLDEKIRHSLTFCLQVLNYDGC